MASIIRLFPISGGAGQETPHCYLLEVDQFTFLLDCGWDPKFSRQITDELKKHVAKIDAVLLSHPGKYFETKCLGNFGFIFGQFWVYFGSILGLF